MLAKPTEEKGKRFGPPRPCAIATIMISDEALAATQTLLYSIKANLRSNDSSDGSSYYQPEIVSLVSPEVSNSVREDSLRPFCTRVIQINDYTTDTAKDDNTVEDIDTHSPDDIVKIQLFKLHVYREILYVDSHCLVQKDVSHLFQNDKKSYHINSVMKECRQIGLVTAPVLPSDSDQVNGSDCFDTSVMVIQPSQGLQKDMTNKVLIDTNPQGFLNAYFHDTWSQLPQEKRLGTNYNCNYDGKKDVNGTQEVIIYSKNIGICGNKTQLYQKWYKKSQLHKENYREEQQMIQKAKDYSQVQQKKKKQRRQQQTNSSSGGNETKAKQMEKHKLVTMRYKELRKQGKNPKESMKIARSEFGMDKDDEKQQSASAQVASMFGMGGLI